MDTTFIVKSSKVLIENGSAPRAASLLIKDGKISEIHPYESVFPDFKIFDYIDLTILPGLVDTHAHINEPGRTEWEGFETATKAALAGGITTVIDMPLNSIPATTSLKALRIKQESALDHCSVDYGFWGGVVPGNVNEIEPMIKAGVMGFKCFLCPSGVNEFEHVTENDLLLAMPILTKHNTPLIVHAELESALTNPPADPNLYDTYLNSRPEIWENDAIEMMIRLCRETRCKTHIVHLSSATALPMIRAAKKEGLPFTVETCPHYLTLTSEEIAAGATHFKCAPPIRSRKNQELLWEAVEDGTIDFIVSDHSPCTPNLKHGDFEKAWGGIAGLQFSMQNVWTEMKRRGMKIEKLSELMSYNTAKFIGVHSRKGLIAIGMDADFFAFNPEESFTLTEAQIHHRHKITPFLGKKLYGNIHAVFLRGQMVYNKGEFLQTSCGKDLS